MVQQPPHALLTRGHPLGPQRGQHLAEQQLFHRNPAHPQAVVAYQGCAPPAGEEQ